jgi:transcriptional regulator with XRE-family HTH domain
MLKRPKITDQLRRIIDTCGLTRYRIAKETGISESALSRLLSGERGVSAKALDKLGALLDLELVMHGPTTTKVAAGKSKTKG